MFLSASLPHLLHLTLLLLLPLTTASTAYESLYTLSAFALQQTCAQACFTQGFANINCYTDILGSLLGCPNTPCSATFAAVDACYCRADLQPAAHDLLSACIDTLCSDSIGDNAVNLATAASIYSGYCSTRGFIAAVPASNTAADTSAQAGAGGVVSTPTSSAASGPTETSSTTSTSTTPASSSSSSSSTLTIALASVSALFALAILATLATCYQVRRRRRRAQQPLYSLGPYPVSPDRLRPSQHSDAGVTEVTPNDSVSMVGSQPAMMWPPVMGPSYPQRQEPSMVSTSFRGAYGPSMAGREGGFSQY